MLLQISGRVPRRARTSLAGWASSSCDATPADVDRLWLLFDEVEGERLMLSDDEAVQLAESRRTAVVSVLLDPRHPVLLAYSGIRAVGYVIVSSGEPPYVSESWRSLGVEAELEQARTEYSAGQ